MHPLLSNPGVSEFVSYGGDSNQNYGWNFDTSGRENKKGTAARGRKNLRLEQGIYVWGEKGYNVNTTLVQTSERLI